MIYILLRFILPESMYKILTHIFIGTFFQVTVGVTGFMHMFLL